MKNDLLKEVTAEVTDLLIPFIEEKQKEHVFKTIEVFKENLDNESPEIKEFVEKKEQEILKRINSSPK